MAKPKETIGDNNSLSRNLSLLQAGAIVSIDVSTPAGQKKKFRTTFIGYLPKKYILIQIPEANKLGNFSQYIVQGSAVTVRGLIEGHAGAVVAFVSSIKQTIQMPSRIMVLDFPKSVTIQALRSAIRIDTEIDAKIRVDKEYWRATITNVSVNGCQLSINDGESLVLADDKIVEIIIENYEGLENLKLQAAICNIKQQISGVSFGVKFLPESKTQVKSILHHAVTLED